MNDLFKILKIQGKNIKLYETSLKHPSYANEKNHNEDYQRLEFLGDAVLELSISDYLYNNYHMFEGDMTKVRANYVCENALARYMYDLGLENFIKLGVGEKKNGGSHKNSVVSDVFEALMGAIYLDLGYQKSKDVILRITKPYIDKKIDFIMDYKTRFQEALKDVRDSITYKLINEEGPAHDKRFTIHLMVDDVCYGEGMGKSKKEAEQMAAKIALTKLVKQKG